VRLLTLTGSIGAFHTRPIPDDLNRPEVWLFDPDHRALVLGSAQQESTADTRKTQSAGIDVVRRRSGGGAVYVDPVRSLWLDVVVPRHDERWSDDVRQATYWLGEAWQRALSTVGVDAELYRGASR